MGGAEALALAFDVAGVGGVVGGDGPPVVLEVAAVAVVALAFEVGGDGGLEEGVVAPGGAVEDGGGVGGGRHGAEVLVELVGGDVLGLVGLQEDAGGGAAGGADVGEDGAGGLGLVWT